MAKQSSFIKLNGTMGGVTFYRTKDGFIAREKGGVSKSRIMTDPRFARTRENIREFSENAKAVKLLQDTIRPISNKVSDSRLHQRMVQAMMVILRTDPINGRGDRKVSEGDWNLLEGLELNGTASVTRTLRSEINHSHTTLTWEVQIPAFMPADFLVYPAGTTHFKITIAGGSLDFASGERSLIVSATNEIPVSSASEAISLVIDKTTLIQSHRVFLLGIEFLQQVNDQFYVLNNGANNAASVLSVEKL